MKYLNSLSKYLVYLTEQTSKRGQIRHKKTDSINNGKINSEMLHRSKVMCVSELKS